MLTKNQFLERINFLLDWNKKVEEFDQALKKFAPSDFSGFFDEKTQQYLLKTLVEDMELDPDDDLIYSWFYNCPQAGKCPEHAKIWVGDKSQDISTPEKLYDYIVSPERESES